MNKKKTTLNILTLIEDCLSEIAHIKELISSFASENETEILRRAYVRKMCTLGELLTYFKEKTNDLMIRQMLQPTDDDNEWLITKFVYFRNKFIHYYIYEHLMGKDDIFLESYTFTKDNLETLEINLKLLKDWKKDKNQTSAEQSISKAIKAGKSNNLFKKDGDYGLLVFTEITSLINFLKSDLQISLDNIANAKEALLAKLNASYYLRLTLENYILSCCQMLLDLTKSTRNNKNNDKIRINLISALDFETKTFLYKIDRYRNNLAHRDSVNKIEIDEDFLISKVFDLISVFNKFLIPLRQKLSEADTSKELEVTIFNTKAWLNNYTIIKPMAESNIKPEIISENVRLPIIDSVQQTVSTVSNTNIIKSPALEARQNALRDRLNDEETVKQKLVQCIPSHYQLGAAIGKGDCFFDAMAQSLNVLKGSNEYTAKSLRLLCDDYVKSGKHAWVKETIEAERDNYEQYLVRIPFTVEELEEEEKKNTGFKLEDIVWGRPEIEGRMICEISKVKLHIIGVLEQPINGIDVTEQLVDAQALEPITTIEKGQYDGSDIVHLVNRQNHFVPLLNSKISQIEKPLIQFAEHSLTSNNQPDNKLAEQSALDDYELNKSNAQPTSLATNIIIEPKSSFQKILEVVGDPVNKNNQSNKRPREDGTEEYIIQKERAKKFKPNIDSVDEITITELKNSVSEKDNENTNTPRS